MNSGFTQPRVVIRPLLSSDTPDIIEFCKYIWDGGDYIPSIWDEWLADPKASMFTAEYGGHAVGFVRILHIAPGQWWMEGFRVDPNYQGLKIGSLINDYINNWWLEHGDGFVRLMTSSQRVKVHHLCERNGYTKINELHDYLASPLAEPVESFQSVKMGEIAEAALFALASPSLILTKGLMDTVWAYAFPNEVTFTEVWEQKRIFWWRGREGLLIYWNDDYTKGEIIQQVGLMASKIESLPEFLLDFRRLANKQDYQWANWIAPAHPKLVQAIELAGFKKSGENSSFLYEKKHPFRP